MIPYLDLHKVNARFDAEFKKEFQSFLNSGRYILGDYVKSFENRFAHYCGTKYCVGTASGLDALTIILKSFIEIGKLKKGDEVLVPANTFIATILSVIHAGLHPVFIEPDEHTYNINTSKIEAAITSNTKAIIVVHLYGQLANIKDIKRITQAYNLLLIEDAAQAHGAQNKKGVKAGNLSDAAAFSFYPSKNLGALGDGGAITTNNEKLYNMVKKLHNYGTSSKYINDYIGLNSRLDELQAMFLDIKLSTLDEDNDKRRIIAKRYISEISNQQITLPYYNGSKDHVFYAFVIQTENRQQLSKYLELNKIGYVIHYPKPPHMQKALKPYNSLNLPITEALHKSVLSLPLNPLMTDSEINKVIKVVNRF